MDEGRYITMTLVDVEGWSLQKVEREERKREERRGHLTRWKVKQKGLAERENEEENDLSRG